MPVSATAVWLGRGITAVVALAFLISGVMKLVGGPDVKDGFAHLGLPISMRVPLSILEIACVVVYLIPTSAVLGAVLLTGYIGGAICTHWRVGDPIYIHVVLGIVVWLGVSLREPRLHAVLPLRKSAQ